jgi:hypothetical protein
MRRLLLVTAIGVILAGLALATVVGRTGDDRMPAVEPTYVWRIEPPTCGGPPFKPCEENVAGADGQVLVDTSASRSP